MSLSSRGRAVLQALVVTFLWSTSWVLMKIGLREIPALTFAGLRYAIAFLVLLPGVWRARREMRTLSRRDWAWLAVLGVVLYALTQGGVFLSMAYLDAIPLSLVLSFTPLVVASVGMVALREAPLRTQWAGMGLALAGALLYFAPATTRGSGLGFALAGFTLCANAAAALLGRSVNRRHLASPIVVTGVSMGIGAVCLLIAGFATQGLPKFSATGWSIVAWLAVVNTAFAFTLWNRTLRVLTATESSVVNNTMMIQIAILAWLFLGERPGPIGIVGLLLAAAGTVLVQLKRRGSVDGS